MYFSLRQRSSSVSDEMLSVLLRSRSFGFVAAFRRTECGDFKEPARDLPELFVLLCCGGELTEL